jgi:myo-inositol-hexaphosphate 3-phosphohydrolase
MYNLCGNKVMKSKFLAYTFLAPVIFAVFGADAPAVAQSVSLAWEIQKQGQFIMSLADDQQGRIFIGTEDKGLWRFDGATTAGKQ